MARTRFSALVPVSRHGMDAPANKYDPEHCWTVRQMAQEGAFPEEWCAGIGITMGTLYHWANTYPDFDRACMESWFVLRAVWTKKARDSVQGVGMAPSVLVKILECRFPDTWGKNARNTQETFEQRNDPPPGSEPGVVDGGTDLQSLDRASLIKRIEELNARREQDE